MEKGGFARTPAGCPPRDTRRPGSFQKLFLLLFLMCLLCLLVMHEMHSENCSENAWTSESCSENGLGGPKRRFSQKTSDFCRFIPCPANSSSWRANHKKPQVRVRQLRSVTLGSAPKRVLLLKFGVIPRPLHNLAAKVRPKIIFEDLLRVHA